MWWEPHKLVKSLLSTVPSTSKALSKCWFFLLLLMMSPLTLCPAGQMDNATPGGAIALSSMSSVWTLLWSCARGHWFLLTASPAFSFWYILGNVLQNRVQSPQWPGFVNLPPFIALSQPQPCSLLPLLVLYATCTGHLSNYLGLHWWSCQSSLWSQGPKRKA